MEDTVLSILWYWLPTIIAICSRHKETFWIFVVNWIFGPFSIIWLIMLGWVLAGIGDKK